MPELAVDVHGITVRLRSPNADFIEFVGRNYEFFASSATNYDIEVDFASYPWRIIPREPPVLATEGLIGLGSGISYRAKDLLRFDHGGLTIQLESRDDKVIIRSFFHEKHRPSIRQWFFTKGALQRGKSQKYQDVMRQILHFPIFWLLERQRGMSLLHAAAVEKEGRGLIFAGLNGSGKTTLAMHLCQQRGCRILADNFLLTDGERIYAFPEVMRFDQRSLDLLLLDKQSSVPVFGKYHYQLDPSKIAPEAEPTNLFITHLGSNTSISPMDTRTALAKIVGIHDFLKEFPEYSYIALMAFVVPEPDFALDRTLVIERLLTTTPCYELQIDRSQPLEQVAEQVMACI